MTLHRPCRANVPLAVALALALGCGPARAGLRDALDSMFVANATRPGAFESQTRGGFVGGSLVARAPIRSINIVTFDAPRLNAGCGGLDLFGGSFSFIDASQLVALLRSIATNAVGALFFIASTAIAWKVVGLLFIGSTVGGQIGAVVGRRLPAPVLRATIAIVGTGVAIKLLIDG